MGAELSPWTDFVRDHFPGYFRLEPGPIFFHTFVFEFGPPRAIMSQEIAHP